MEAEFSVEPYRHDKEVLKQTIHQLQKDFALADVALDEYKPSAYENILEKILPYIRYLSENKKEKFLALIYRIDVSEQQIRNALKKDPSVSFEEIVSELIIKRTLQKVVLRKLYASGQN